MHIGIFILSLIFSWFSITKASSDAAPLQNWQMPMFPKELMEYLYFLPYPVKIRRKLMNFCTGTMAIAENRYDQAVRMGKWKGIREGKNSDLQLYNLEIDIAEENDVAEMNPDIVKKINKMMKEAYVPVKRYPIGDIYSGGPIWKKERIQNY